MLKELAKLSGGMLFLGGHISDVETVRRLARPSEPAAAPVKRPVATAPTPKAHAHVWHPRWIW